MTFESVFDLLYMVWPLKWKILADDFHMILFTYKHIDQVLSTQESFTSKWRRKKIPERLPVHIYLMELKSYSNLAELSSTRPVWSYTPKTVARGYYVAT